MKKLLLIIPLLAGCAREYQCCPEGATGEEGCRGPIYTVDWPKGKKAAEEQCGEDYEGTVQMDEYGEVTSIVQGCECEKAN